MTETFTTACVQNCASLQPKETTDRAEELIREAAAKGVDTLAVREITADDIRFHFAAAQPRTLAQQSSAEKPRKGDANSTIQRNPPRMSRAERRRQDFLQQSVMQPEIRMPNLDSAEPRIQI